MGRTIGAAIKPALARSLVPALLFILAAGLPAMAQTGTGGPSISSVSPSELFYGPTTLPTGLTVTGSGFVNGSQIVFNGTRLKTSFQSSTKLAASLALQPVVGNVALVTVTNPGFRASAPYEVQLAVSAPRVSYTAAFRFLEQATFGPTTQDLINLQQTGFQAWLNAQKTAKESSFPSPLPNSAIDFAQATFMYNAMNGPDQLRQRVSFALGQILVVSELKLKLEALMPYLQLLQDNAFGNYRTLLQAVTLSPGMGHYLDMVNNAKPNRARGTLPNENYARELLQLFSIGTVMLNPDGTRKLDPHGDTISLYGESDIQNLARVLTGWTYPTHPGARAKVPNPPYFIGPMIPVEAYHDKDPKTFLGKTLPGGQSAEADLTQALDIIFDHPNVGPFVSLRLIQHLVTSNPNPAYVERVAKVFDGSGSGARGDLWAVINAIVTDPEARQGDDAANAIATGGHLREPVLYTTAMLRALGASIGPHNRLVYSMYPMGQTLLLPPSVFNYYSPFYRIPSGAAAGPEFQLFSPATAVVRANFALLLILSKLGTDTTVSFAPFIQLAADPNALLDAVSNALMGGRMPSAMRNTIMTAMDAAGDPATIAFDALYLTAGSGLYQVEQ